STAPSVRREEVASLQRWALGIGVVALLVCIVPAIFDPVQFFRTYLAQGDWWEAIRAAWLFGLAQFFRAYLAAYVFYLGLALGSFALLALYHLTGGAWGFLIRRVLEAGMRTLPLLAFLFMPVGFGAWHLYPWARWTSEEIAATPNLQIKHIYLNL